MTRAKFIQIIATSRPKFLLLTPCCLSLAVAYAIAEHIAINYTHLMLIFLGAIAAHASVNMFNEYGDFTSGLDFHTQRTPFSGGSGTLPSVPELASSVRLAAVVCLSITVGIGFYFLGVWGWGMLPVGLLGICLIYFYTDNITHRPLLCLIAPGLAFGPLMINGAYYALSGHHNAAVFAASVVVFFLVNNLLLLNQFPDLEADQNAGRHHLPILIGRKKSALVYVFFLVAAFTVLLANIRLSFLPLFSLLAFLTAPFVIAAGKMAVEYAEDIERLKPALALNVAVTLATPVLMAAGIVLQSQFSG